MRKKVTPFILNTNLLNYHYETHPCTNMVAYIRITYLLSTPIYRARLLVPRSQPLPCAGQPPLCLRYKQSKAWITGPPAPGVLRAPRSLRRDLSYTDASHLVGEFVGFIECLARFHGVQVPGYDHALLISPCVHTHSSRRQNHS